jgi:hypothetical protein
MIGTLLFTSALSASMPFMTQQSPFLPDAALDLRAKAAVNAAVSKFAEQKVQEDQLAVTIVELDRTKTQHRMGQFRGDEMIYPASVVKLFYLAHAHHLMEQGELQTSRELERALSDMIRWSSNDATHLIVDTLTGTTGGPELPTDEFEEWSHKRHRVNRWYQSMGYTGVNACQKTWGEGPYGRERQFYGEKFENRNMLSANATARLMTEIALRKMVTRERSEAMLDLLKRKIPADAKDADNQSREFIGQAMPSGTEHYSKAGWTSNTKHDVAFLRLPNGKELVIAIYTRNQSNTKDLLPFIAEQLVAAYR